MASYGVACIGGSMRTRVWGCIALTLSLACPAAAIAASVYKCKDAEGRTVFTDKKCEYEATPQKIWDSNLSSQQYPPMFSGATPEEAQAADRLVQGTQQDQTIRTPQPGGYLCSAGSKTWVQTSSCPSVIGVPRTTTIRHGDGSYSQITRDSPTHVHQDELSRDALCANLGAALSAYERNRIATERGCR